MPKRRRRKRRKTRRKNNRTTRRKYIRTSRKYRKIYSGSGKKHKQRRRLIDEQSFIGKPWKRKIARIEAARYINKQQRRPTPKWMRFKSKKKKKISPKKPRRGPLTPLSPPTTFARGPKTNKMINDNDSIASEDTIWEI